MNGKLGDHPLTDIVAYHMPVYSRAIDTFVSELIELAGREKTEGLLRGLGILWAPKLVTPGRDHRTRVQLDPSQLQEAETELRSRRDALMLNAERSGWDMEALRSRIEERRLAVGQAWKADQT